MTNLLQALVRSEKRSDSWGAPSWDGFLDYFSFGGSQYPISNGLQQTLPGAKEERIVDSFEGLARSAHKGNSIIFSLMEFRRRTFAQARFSWQRINDDGSPGEFVYSPELRVLERPQVGASTSDLLSRLSQHADFGNAFVVRPRRDRLVTLRPDWMTIVAGSQEDPDSPLDAVDAEIVAYVYQPGGKASGKKPQVLLPNEVAHYAPVPDPSFRFRGMSWITAVTREVMGDNAATNHKLRFFENGATPNLVVSLDPAINTTEKFDAWVEAIEQKTKGTSNAYRTLYLGAGADVEVVGANLRQLDFKATQGAGETRIASAAGVPPALVGFSEGLQGSSLNAGNYSAARRSYSDTTLWDLWDSAAGALQTILRPPENDVRLWVNPRGIPFLQEDEKDRAEIQTLDASAINTLVIAGYTPPSVVDAVTSGDLTRLVHSGLYSVQLQPAGAAPDGEAADTGQALIEGARQKLLAAGIKPTQVAIAEMLEVDERTVRRWQKG